MATNNCLAETFPGRGVITSDEVHVWLIGLNVQWPTVRHLRRLLSSAEVSRAERFSSDAHRARFVTAHGVTRIILGSYVNTEAHSLRFGFNRYGKPMLSGRPDPYQINFNLSHSCDMALLAVARGRNVGIDIEFCQEIGLDEVLAPEVFSQREVQAFNQLSTNKRVETFYAHWTQKEAWVKAIGYGLGYPFQIPEFAFSPGDSVRLAATFASGGEVRWWSVRSLDVARGYVGAVAVEGDDWNLYLFAYDPKGLPDPASASVRLKAPDCQVAGL